MAPTTIGSGVYENPVSAPEEPEFSTTAFQTASSCGGCHAQHEREWRQSPHARAMTDPVYQAMIRQQRLDIGVIQDRFCTQCHSAIGTRSGDVMPGFDFDALSAITREGVTCEACHAVVGLDRPSNSGHIIDPTAPIQGPIRDPSQLAGHASAYSPLHEQASFCAGCHDVVDERTGFELERPYVEWQGSSAAQHNQPCQSCHMASYRGTATALTGVPRRKLHRHTFSSVAPILTEPGADPELAQSLYTASVQLLQGSAEIDLDAPNSFRAGEPIELGITLHNRIEGHAFPTGSTFNRQFWLAVEVTDAEGTLVYASGALDAQDDLGDGLASPADRDPDLVLLGKRLLDAQGDQTLFGWRAASVAEPISIAAGDSRDFAYRIPSLAATPGTLDVRVRLRFRGYSPRLLRALALDDLVDQLRIIDIDERTVTLTPE